MPEKSKTETPPPSMADVIRQRAYQMWGVAAEEEPLQKAPRKSGGAKKAKAAAKPARRAGKAKTTK